MLTTRPTGQLFTPRRTLRHAPPAGAYGGGQEKAPRLRNKAPSIRHHKRAWLATKRGGQRSPRRPTQCRSIGGQQLDRVTATSMESCGHLSPGKKACVSRLCPSAQKPQIRPAATDPTGSRTSNSHRSAGRSRARLAPRIWLTDADPLGLHRAGCRTRSPVKEVGFAPVGGLPSQESGGEPAPKPRFRAARKSGPLREKERAAQDGRPSASSARASASIASANSAASASRAASASLTAPMATPAG
jgi:hypothetical protein